MARSKVKKSTREKIRRERSAEQARVKNEKRLFALSVAILKDNPPVPADTLSTREEVEAWFDNDPKAPLVAVLPGPYTQGSEEQMLQVSVNARAIERELRGRGIDESHPDWETAYQMTRHLALETAREMF